MIVNFRHGIVSSFTSPATGQPDFLDSRGTLIDLRITGGRPFVFTIAHGQTNYIFTIEQSIANAWVNFNTPQFPGGVDYHLYIDINNVTAVMTFGQTRFEPSVGKAAPPNPQVDQHWYDTQNFRMKVWNGSLWVEKIRLFVGKYVNTSTIEHARIGSQIGVITQTYAGKIVFGDTSRPIRKQGGEFFTTEDYIYVNGTVQGPNVLDTRLLTVRASMPIPRYSVVKFTDFNTIAIATYSDTGSSQLAFARTSATTGETIEVLTQGIIENPMWNWSTVGAHVYVDRLTGQLTTVNPALGLDFNGNPIVDEDGSPVAPPAPQPPVGRVVGVNAVRFVPPVTGLEVIGQIQIENGGTGASTQQDAINNLVGDVSDRKFLVGDGTNAIMRQIEVEDIPNPLTQDTTGSAARLTTARTLSTTGDGTWSISFDGSTDVSGAFTLANTTVVPGGYHRVVVDQKGRVLSGTNPTTLAGFGIVDAQPLNANLTTLTEATQGLLAKINATTVQSRSIVVSGNGIAIANGSGVTGNPTITVNSTSANTPNTIVFRDSSGNIEVGQITATGFVGPVAGTATAAEQLQTARSISITGDLAWTTTFDGSVDVTGIGTLATVNAAPGTYGTTSSTPIITVNDKGLVTSIVETPIPDGELTVNTSGNGLSGSGTFTANQSTNNTITINSNATPFGLPNTIVYRDEDGSFSANQVIASQFIGQFTGAVVGNADSASELQTARSISITGDIVWTTLFDGSVDVTGVGTLATVNTAPGTYGSTTTIPVVTVNNKGLATSVSVVDVPNGQLTVNVSGNGLSGSGTFTANQSTNNTITINSNATANNTPSTVVFRDSAGGFSAGAINATDLTLSGNLTVNGTTTTINTTNLTVEDAIIELARGNNTASAPYIGIEANRGAVDAYWVWDESTDSWMSALSSDGVNFTLAPIRTSVIIGAVSGNSSSATSLETPRQINGTLFDGTADITTNSWGTARNITIGNTTRTVNGSANVSWSLADIGVNDGTLTLTTSGIATGSQTFSANQTTNATFTVNVPPTNLSYTTAASNGVINSSTGTGATIPGATGSVAGLMSSNDKAKLDASTPTTVINTLMQRDGNGDFTSRRGSLGGFAGTLGAAPNTLEIRNNGGTGDANLASISLHCTGTYATHLSLRNDGIFGVGGWSAASWRWFVNMTNGTMTAAGDVVAFSDKRLKTNIKKIDGALEKLHSISGYTFDRIDTNERQAGVIAQEVEQVLPEVVHTDENGMKSVAYGNITALLIEAIKEQQQQIGMLRLEIAQLRRNTK